MKGCVVVVRYVNRWTYKVKRKNVSTDDTDPNPDRERT